MMLIGLAVIMVYVNIIHIIALLKKDNSIMDIAWGPGFVFLAVFTFLFSDTYELRQILISSFITLWGFRLCIYIGIKKWGKGEDFRYQKWRKSWGKWFYLRSYFQIFILQGIFMYIIGLPIILVNSSSGVDLGILDWLGSGVFATGFFFEVVGDWQLLRFMKDSSNKGKIMRHGLWRYTRHPNYFGEAFLWWGIFLIAFNVPWGWLGLISPLAINWLLLFVSGIPMLEKKYDDNIEYQEYKNVTSGFIPWFPKKS